MKKLFLCGSFLALVIGGSGASAETPPVQAQPDESAYYFFDLAEKKASSVVKLGTLRQEVVEIEKAIPEAQGNEEKVKEMTERIRDLERTQQTFEERLKTLSETPIPAGRDESEKRAREIESIRSRIDRIQREVELRREAIASRQQTQTVAKLKEILAQKQLEIAQTAAQLDEVQKQILKITTPEQSFKRNISGHSTILIGLVIAGFFVIAGIDAGVRQSVFAGQAGIQFLALFSIVIAIILFGITGILKGNELSALLGSISGYILGKVTASEKRAEQQTRADQAAPVEGEIREAPAR